MAKATTSNTHNQLSAALKVHNQIIDKLSKRKKEIHLQNKQLEKMRENGASLESRLSQIDKNRGRIILLQE